MTAMGNKAKLSRRVAAGLGAVGMAMAVVACEPQLSAPGDTTEVHLVSTATVDGWKFDYYVNEAYPCSISGYQTFTIGTKVGSSPTASAPMWVRMRGGGVGWFDEAGQPQPSTANKNQENANAMRDRLLNGDIMALVRDDPADFRLLSVSMCDHDIYGGGDIPDPHNPNTLPDGSTRTVNGLFATKAAIRYATAKYPTGGTILHGTSAGGYGTFNVAWGLEEEGNPPAGLISDSGVLNQAWQLASVDQGLCPSAELGGLETVQERLHSQLRPVENQPDRLVGDGRLTVPIMQVWDRGDFGQCGETPMSCPLPDGSSVTMGSVDCMHEPLRAAIAAQGPTSRSANMRLCVDGPRPGSCDVHTPTNSPGAVNTDPAFPADFNPLIMDWVHDRLADG
jgi:hypothetical protein